MTRRCRLNWISIAWLLVIFDLGVAITTAAAKDLSQNFTDQDFQQLIYLSKRGSPRENQFSAIALLNDHLYADPSDVDTMFRVFRGNLESTDPDIREAATYLLANSGVDLTPLANVLIEKLKDNNKNVRWTAAIALDNIDSSEITQAIPALITAISDPDSLVRREAIRSLGIIGAGNNHQAVLSIAQTLQDQDSETAAVAAEALGNIGEDARPAVSALVDSLNNKNARARAASIKALGKMGDAAAPAVAAIGRKLADPDVEVRKAAALVLRDGPTPTAAVSDLANVAGDASSDVETRVAAIQALSRLGPDEKTSVPSLIAALKQSDQDVVREAAANALGAGGVGAEAAVPALTTALEDADPKVRVGAAYALGSIPLSDACVPALAHAIADQDPELKKTAAVAFITMITAGSIAARAEAPKVAPILVDDTDPDLRFIGVQLLIVTTPAQSILRLAKAVSDPDVRIRLSAVTALTAENSIGPVGASYKEINAALAGALKDPNSLIRKVAASGLKSSFGSDDRLVVSALIAALNDNDENVELSAINSLGGIKNSDVDIKTSLPTLRQLLKGGSSPVRQQIATLFGTFGTDSEIVEIVRPSLQEALEDPDENVRVRAAASLSLLNGRSASNIGQLTALLVKATTEADPTLRQIASGAFLYLGDKARAAVPDLLKALDNPDPQVRVSAATALSYIHDGATAAVPKLILLLDDREPQVREEVPIALGAMGAEAKSAVPRLLQLLDSQNERLRSNIILSLGEIGQKTTIPATPLIKCLEDPSPSIRRSAVYAVASLGENGISTIPQLIKMLSDQTPSVRESTAEAIQNMGQNLVAAKSSKGYALLDKALAEMRRSSDPILRDTYAAGLYQWVQAMKPPPGILRQSETFVTDHPIGSTFLATGVVWLSILLLLFWIWPIKMMNLNETLMSFDFKLPEWAGGSKVPLNYLLIVGFFGYRRRLLDAWVSSVAPIARERFKQKDTVRDRQIYIPLPVIFNNEVLSQVFSDNLRELFRRRVACLLVYGEGGCGKTSLACLFGGWAMAEQIEARLTAHIMLPVMIEQELPAADGEISGALLAAIRRQLQDVTDAIEPVSPQRLNALLRNQRVLVIIDHLSEMPNSTRSLIDPGSPSFPVNSLIVTSRIREPLGSVAKMTMQPLLVEGNRLSGFMDAYLRHSGARDLFEDSEFFEICRLLSIIVGERKITVFLAKLYAEQQILNKREVSQDDLPNNIPELMLTYVNQINRNVDERRMSISQLHEDAKLIAWKCVERNLVPEAVNRNVVAQAIGGEDAAERLEYFINRLNLIRTVEPNNIRFALDPLAEYLAGLYAISTFSDNWDQWRQFLRRADELRTFEKHADFFAVLLDCVVAQSAAGTGDEHPIPPFVKRELQERAAGGQQKAAEAVC